MWLVYAAGVGLLLALVRREWRAVLLATYAGLIVFTVVPHVVGLPGTGVIDSFAAYLALYALFGPLAGYALAVLLDWAATRLRLHNRAPALVCAAVVLLAAVWGIGWQRGILTPQVTQILTQADADAMTWISANTPRNARFLVNAFPAFGGTLLVGSDGGWWLQFLTGRQSTLPPATYGSERGVSDQPKVRDSIVGLWEKLRGRPIRDLTAVRVDVGTPVNIATLRAHGVTHIYDGANAEPREREDWLDTSTLRNSPDFRLIYEQDGVRIFEMR